MIRKLITAVMNSVMAPWQAETRLEFFFDAEKVNRSVEEAFDLEGSIM